MHRYIIKRLLFLIPTVLGVTLIIFISPNSIWLLFSFKNLDFTNSAG